MAGGAKLLEYGRAASSVALVASARPIGIDDGLARAGPGARRRPRRAPAALASRQGQQAAAAAPGRSRPEARSHPRETRAGTPSMPRGSEGHRGSRREPGASGSSSRARADRAPSGRVILPRAATAACWSRSGDLRPEQSEQTGRDRCHRADGSVSQQPTAARPRSAAGAASSSAIASGGRPERQRTAFSSPTAGSASARSRASSKPASEANCQAANWPPCPAGCADRSRRFEGAQSLRGRVLEPPRA